jgi:hypothetical protein
LLQDAFVGSRRRWERSLLASASAVSVIARAKTMAATSVAAPNVRNATVYPKVIDDLSGS